MFSNLLRRIARFFGLGIEETKRPKRNEQRYVLKEFDDRSAAALAARRLGVAALVRGSRGYKWLLFCCPCGCHQQIALNLMQSHTPHWVVDIKSPDCFTLHPSVDATSCGAHFWLRNGTVSWCE